MRSHETKYVITYDVGTTSLKTCLFSIGENIELIISASKGYNLTILDNGGAEQNPSHWWNAMCTTTKQLLMASNVQKEQIEGISFCAQMQGVVLVDKNGDAVRNAMSYMDNRGKKQMDDAFGHGLKVEGVNIGKLVQSVGITGIVASSTKDPVWKYKWVEENEPDVFKKVYKWLDVKEYLICRATDKFVMTQDSAYATMLFGIRGNKRGFSKSICKMLGVDYKHMPKLILGSEVVGNITSDAAAQLGLSTKTEVYGGGGDASLIGVGAGATKLNDTHIYMGTSGWVSTVIKKPLLDITHKIAGIVGADNETYNYFAEIETAGKCIEWVKKHLAYEETIERISGSAVDGNYEEVSVDLYDYMMDSIKDVPAGSNGIIFTPWLHGNRCPFEDTNARGMFFNIGINSGKREMIHAVVEGVCYHLRWQLESSRKNIVLGSSIRLVGGGALAPVTCQILADVLGLTIEVIHDPQNAGAMGAVILVAVGLGIIDNVKNANSLIAVDKTYHPNTLNKKVYDNSYEVFKALYYSNKDSFYKLNNLAL